MHKQYFVGGISTESNLTSYKGGPQIWLTGGIFHFIARSVLQGIYFLTKLSKFIPSQIGGMLLPIGRWLRGKEAGFELLVRYS